MALQLEIWTDIVCPWCGLGNRRLNLALERFSHKDQVTVTHRSFQLDPSAPEGVTRSVRDMLLAKGMSEAQLEGAWERLETLAQQDGLVPYHVRDNRVGNTSLAHELATWAAEQGKGTAMRELLFTAYFGEQHSIFEVDALVALAARLGLDAEQAKQALTSRRYREQVRAEGEEAQALGVRGVPFVAVDRRFAVSGAQSVETFLGMLKRAWAERDLVASQSDLPPQAR